MEIHTAKQKSHSVPDKVFFAAVNGATLAAAYFLGAEVNALFGAALVLGFLLISFAIHELSKISKGFLYDYFLAMQLTTMAVIVAELTTTSILLLSIPVYLGLLAVTDRKSFIIPLVSLLVFAQLIQKGQYTGQWIFAFSAFSVSLFANTQINRMKEKVCSNQEDLDNIKRLRAMHLAFVREISAGRFTNSNLFDTNDGMGNALFDMSIRLKDASREETIRSWKMNGLNDLGGMLRSGDLRMLYSDLISFLVRYLKANQGGLFIVNKEKSALEMKSCYAYERNKMVGKNISITDGLLGECLAEGEMIYMEKIPANYIHITSGLGLATPTALVILPLCHNKEVVGVIEMASFAKFQKHELEFLKDACGVIGAAILSHEKNIQTELLLRESQQMAEELKTQQEEVRQNLEELEATQEYLNREIREKEKLQADLKKSREFLNLVIDSVPLPLFVKDRQHRMVLLNKAVCNLNNMTREEMLGKTDYDFFTPDEAHMFRTFEEGIFKSGKVAEKVEHAIRNGKETYTLDKKLSIRTTDGEEFLVGINIDVTDSMMREKQLREAARV
jgi:PAS domain S-box-containing protein